MLPEREWLQKANAVSHGHESPLTYIFSSQEAEMDKWSLYFQELLQAAVKKKWFKKLLREEVKKKLLHKNCPKGEVCVYDKQCN